MKKVLKVIGITAAAIAALVAAMAYCVVKDFREDGYVFPPFDDSEEFKKE